MVAVATKQRRATLRPLSESLSLGWKCPDKLGPRLGGIGLVAQQQPVDLGLVDDLAAAMIGEPHRRSIVIARDPRPARPRGQAAQQRARVVRQPFAAPGIMETVAEAPDFLRARRFDQRGEFAQRRMRVVGRQHLPAGGIEARLLEMQVGDQQRTPRRPAQRARHQGGQLDPGERKVNHAAPLAARIRQASRLASGALVG